MVIEEYITLTEAAKIIGKSKETLGDGIKKVFYCLSRTSFKLSIYKLTDIQALMGELLPKNEGLTSNVIKPIRNFNVLELFAGAGDLAVGMEKLD